MKLKREIWAQNLRELKLKMQEESSQQKKGNRKMNTEEADKKL